MANGLLIIPPYREATGTPAPENLTMAAQRSHLADKIIVDRRKSHRNSDVARAVRRTREQLAQQTRNPEFERELLKLHARSILSGIKPMGLLIALIVAAGVLAANAGQILVWAGATIAAHVGLLVAAKRLDQAVLPGFDVARATTSLLGWHFVSGLGWVYLSTVECGACGASGAAILKAIALLLAMAGTALVGATLRGALMATFAAPIAAYLLLAANFTSPGPGATAALLLAALPFLNHIAWQFHRGAVLSLSFQTQRDSLIGELETAKSMSDEARSRAEEANLAKSRFLASMSHELRTPLNAILGFSEVMASEVLGPLENPVYRDYARDIHNSGHHLLALINEILDLSRIEAGRYQLNEEVILIVQTVEECCHLMELKARNKDLRIVQQFENGLPRLCADERAVRQITLNLLSNAIKFTPTGGEIVVRVGWTAGGGQYISVKDNGPGIPLEEIPVVLSAFGQGSIAIKSAEQGTGLGLPIVQGLLALHGGAFELHSKLREGAEAIAIFPPTRVMEELPALPTEAISTGRRS